MYFDSFHDFITMGGHGLYVWLSYGIFAVILICLIWRLKSHRRQMIKSARKTWLLEQNSVDKAL